MGAAGATNESQDQFTPMLALTPKGGSCHFVVRTSDEWLSEEEFSARRSSGNLRGSKSPGASDDEDEYEPQVGIDLPDLLDTIVGGEVEERLLQSNALVRDLQVRLHKAERNMERKISKAAGSRSKAPAGAFKNKAKKSVMEIRLRHTFVLEKL